MLKAFKYRIYPNVMQAENLAKQFGCVRFIYNWGLQQKITSYQTLAKGLTRFQLDKQLPALKKEKEWLTEVASQPLQQALVNLESAFVKFFKEKKGFPKFHSKHTHNSANYPQGVSVDFETNRITIPKLGKVKAKLSRIFEGVIRTCTVSKNKAGQFFISVLVDVENQDLTPKPLMIQTAVGIDLGIKHFAVLSTGEKIENPKHLEKALMRLKVLHKRFSRKQKSGKNREKARIQLARGYQRVTDCRNDFLHKVSTRVVNEFNTVCLETLNVAGMLKNHKLARRIADVGWSRFTDFIEYKTAWVGKHTLRIGTFEPSSRVCGCGWYNRDLKLKTREWLCPACNTLNDRDGLAANNIKKFAFLDHKTHLRAWSLIQGRADPVSLGSHGAVMPGIEPRIPPL